MSRRAATHYPLSDHYDGEHFFNPGPGLSRGVAPLLRWRLSHAPTPWPKAVIDPAYPPPPPLPPEHLGLSFIGHASFLLRLPGFTLLTDPIFSDRCSPVSWAGPRRVRPPGLALASLPAIDAILLSHNHYDHLDLPSLRALHRAQPGAPPRIVTTLGNAPFLARAGLPGAQELDWWQSTWLGSLRITATPARHFAARTPFDRNRTLWGGFMLALGKARILFGGDSGAGPHWSEIRQRLGAPDVALLPIGAYEPRWFMRAVHMNPEEAVAAHYDLAAARSFGMHFGTFRLTDEPIDAPPEALAQARLAAGLKPESFTTLGFGESIVLPLPGV
jgi:L-ascorbate metabolism protein UlaG (beta-lactamase superfamily)